MRRTLSTLTNSTIYNAKIKPTLYIKMADIFAIHNLVATDLPHICPNRDDMLREMVQELGSAKNNETEMLGVSNGEILMTLNPKLHDIEDPEAEVKALFMETKRCVLYIIRVQSGPNLMDILVRPITQEDDYKWHTLLREEFSDGSKTRGAYSDANTLVDIKSMSYKELKRTALENIMRLEQLGRISRHNFYQDILNAIALDIRTKSRRRVQRQRELEGVRLTLGNLTEKAEWLESQRKSYDNYIEQAMMTLQKKGYVFFLIHELLNPNNLTAKSDSLCLSPSSTTTSGNSSVQVANQNLDPSSTQHVPSLTRVFSSHGKATTIVSGTRSTSQSLVTKSVCSLSKAAREVSKFQAPVHRFQWTASLLCSVCQSPVHGSL